ncbi:MAG: YqeG family HAD IIIA-type phosphatase [Oscillospiraceae bacterium]|nr:YqeG family HAD IIIA-type phosphatase [Oscillospiraceae bacterium]
MLFKPTFVFNTVTEITSAFLKQNGIKGLILDLDNTLTTHNNPKPPKYIIAWINAMKSADIPLVIVSNNKYDRVRPFAQMLQLPFISDGAKPLTKGIDEARKAMRLSKNEVAIVGDQIFTDMLGANIKRMPTIYVYPIELEDGLFFRFKRVLETPFLPRKHDFKSRRKKV